MLKKLIVTERLIVAADFKPSSPSQGRIWVRDQVLSLADKLSETGVCLKINSALRACGYDLIDEIHSRGLSVFADLKLFDIKETLSIDGMFLREAKPELLTVVCTAGITAMNALKLELPDTEVLGVTVLTSLTEDDAQAMFVCSVEEAVLRLAQMAKEADIDGFISSAKEVEMLKKNFGIMMSLNTPAIRPSWSIVPGDDQNPERIMTPEKAILAGADRLVIGRPITQNANPYEAVRRTLDEIHNALMKRGF
jgi:orotidine-5'-phosphate decarboxylase